jgi:hypothetical protein
MQSDRISLSLPTQKTMIEMLTSNESPESVLANLERFGVALIPNYLPNTKLEPLRNECFALLKHQEQTSTFLSKGGSRVARIQKGLDAVKYPLAHKIFSDGFFNELAREYFSPHPYSLNRQVYITHDVNVMDFSADWHNDPTRSLKFMLYLMDTTAENGAFMYAPGSHREGYFRLISSQMRGDQPENKLPESEFPLLTVSIEAPAGSLIVFEAAGFHKAGDLTPGRERLVMRGHSYAKTNPRIDRIKRLLLRSPLNIARHIHVADEYINSRFKTKAVPYI